MNAPSFPSAGILGRGFPINIEGSTGLLMGPCSSVYSCWENTQSPHKGTQSISGFADSSGILLSDLPHIKSKEVFLASTHNIPIPPTPPPLKRVTLHPGPEPHKRSLAVEELLEAPALACLCDSSIRGVCYTAIIQSHLKCSPLGSNTTLGSNR